jgi:hypothetical protein
VASSNALNPVTLSRSRTWLRRSTSHFMHGDGDLIIAGETAFGSPVSLDIGCESRLRFAEACFLAGDRDRAALHFVEGRVDPALSLLRIGPRVQELAATQHMCAGSTWPGRNLSVVLS